MMHTSSRVPVPESLAKIALKYYLTAQITAKQEEIKKLDVELKKQEIELMGHGVGGIDAQLALYSLLKNAELPLPSFRLMVRNSFRAISERANQTATIAARRLMADDQMKIDCTFIETQGCPTFLLGEEPQYLLQGFSPACRVLQVKDASLVKQLSVIISNHSKISEEYTKVGKELKQQRLAVVNRRELETKQDLYSKMQKLLVASLETEEDKKKSLEANLSLLMREFENLTVEMIRCETQAFCDMEHSESAKVEFSPHDLSGMRASLFPDAWDKMQEQKGLQYSEKEFKRELKIIETSRPRIWGEDHQVLRQIEFNVKRVLNWEKGIDASI